MLGIICPHAMLPPLPLLPPCRHHACATGVLLQPAAEAGEDDGAGRQVHLARHALPSARGAGAADARAQGGGTLPAWLSVSYTGGLIVSGSGLLRRSLRAGVQLLLHGGKAVVSCWRAMCWSALRHCTAWPPPHPL